MPDKRDATPSRRPGNHLLLVLAAALGALVPAYWLDGGTNLRPSRVLGPVGLPGTASADLDNRAADAVTPRPPARPTVTPAAASSSAPSPNSKIAAADSRPAANPAASNTAAAPVTEATKVKPSPAPTASALSPAPANTAGNAAGRAVKAIPVLPIDGVEHLRPFFNALARSDRTAPVRVLHYGDSTLAGDGIAKTVRQRLKAEFGDGGPGFFVAGMDPRWMRRDDVRVTRSGEWDIFTILNGGNQGRYGLGGIVAKPRGAAAVQLAPARSGQALGHRLEVYTQKPRKPEAIRAQINGAASAITRRIEHSTFDQWVIEHDQPIVSSTLQIGEAGLEVYGLVLEASRGISWETTAVVGIASGSIRQFNADHLAEQTRVRNPDLIVVMIGGNDAGSAGILAGDGKSYREGFMRAIKVLRRGAPQAACLLMSPLDQATLGDDGRIYSKKTMARLVELQRQASEELGCAFWNSWQFMGGQNSFARWLDQGLAWTDLMHLTEKGLNRIGQGLSEALLASYEQQRRGQ